ncbi:MBL fold metallo-hydrolase [Stygiolobus azoricus]|uniref:MBL fold metallo-hydrolase n=1 Tax=Stygiolobus azoricus TaxID=41675 RepID=A0A650CPD5_9CREN|nr:MBL fold metallo-hydrolase [Stygiolobus azoricus]QGR19699.1 MBL fold metallo-hydrolase [Stygiolobus azoricus]
MSTLRPQLTLTEGSITLEIYGGYREIGGNCIVIKDRDKKIVFDNGIRFQVLRKYYRGSIRPLGINELRSIGAIPPLNVFENIDALYISHFHLDHLGLLGALPPGTRVYVPSISILETIEEWYRASSTWLAELPRKLHIEVIELIPHREDERGVTPIPVSHSAYPSYALVYNGYDKTIFYSGDFRVSGPLGPRINTTDNIDRVLGSGSADIALLEGTNIGGIETPIGSEEFRSILNKVLMGSGLAMISIDPLDFELLTAISELASLNGRTVVISSSRLVDILPQWLSSAFNANNLMLAVASDLEKPSLAPVDYVSLKHDVLKDPGGFLLVQEPIGFLEMLRRMRIWGEELPNGAIAILTTPEPLEAEAEVEEKTLAYWLYMLGVHVYRIRLSGHYYPHELKNILNTVKPKKLIPIHTRHPSLVLKLANSR